jgi:integrase
MAFVRQRGKSWYAYWDEFDGGKRIPRAQSFKRDKRAAEAFVILKNADKIRGVQEPSKETLHSFWKRYEVEKLPALTEKVQDMYSKMYERLLLPYFTGKPLGAIRRTDVRAWMTWAEGQAEDPEKGNAGSIQKAFTVLSSILGYALDLDVIPANPCSGMGKYLPKVKDPRKRPHLSSNQVLALVGEVHRAFKAPILSMAVLGLRPSECVALRVGDLDLDKEVLYVRRAAVDVPGKGMVERDETKTGNPRTIPLMGTEQAFKDHLSFRYDIDFWVEEMGPRRIPHKDDLLFESPRNGTEGIINEPALAKLVKEAGKRIGVKGLSADDLRHSAYANLIELTNGDISFAQRVLGHTSPHMGLVHYDTVTPARYDKAIEAVKRELRRLDRAPSEPLSGPRSSPGTSTTSTSMTRAAAATEEWTVSAAANRQPPSGSDALPLRATSRAVTSAERFPAEPPLTNAPPADAGMPARSAIHRRAWFSAQIAPAPSIHPAAIVEEDPTTRSNSTLAFVGAPGMNESAAGWSVEIVAGASTSVQIRNASSPPRPSGTIVSPARWVSSPAGKERSRGCGFAMRLRT